ncbi:uncharacterized protein [Panulirus ornatus]|uniref:uncharacterized protein isoform X1 n=1 Tax=Panulirus ornatus TaxID=150431 RepID=UPI003A8C1F4A
MSGLTKEQLRNELVTHGVELPSSGAKKDEYLRLYEKYVAPVEQSKGDFSSDDEDIPVNEVDTQASLETSMVIDGLDISKLDDDELFSRLEGLGASVGPIVDTTRQVYQKKLFTLLGGEIIESPSYNGDVGEEEYSDSEEEVVVEMPRETRSSVVESLKTLQTMATSPPPSEATDFRRRILLSSGEKSNQPSVVYDPERHTPSPRRSLRTVTSSSSETVTVHRFMNNSSMSGKFREEFDTRHFGHTNATSTSKDSSPIKSTSKTSVYLRLLIKMLFLILIIGVVFYFYQNNNSESPFKAVEQLARQALEAAVGEEAAIDTEEGPAEPDVPPAEEKAPIESQ